MSPETNHTHHSPPDGASGSPTGPLARAGERTFRTDGGPADNDSSFELQDSGVRDLPVSIDWVKLTGEGKLQIALTGEALRGEDLAKVRDLLLVMSGRLRVDFTPEQAVLPL